MHDAQQSWSSVIWQAPFIRQHGQHKSLNTSQDRWFRIHHPDQYLETEPSSGAWLRSQLPTKQEAIQYLKDSFPCTQWILRYNLSWLVGDLIAGLTVGAVIIPQGMAYARLAELPVEMGLYSSFIGSVLYFMFGSSKDINIGPIAIASIVTSSIIDDVQSSLPQESRTEIAGLIALMAGAVIFVIAILRLGWLVNLIALPAIAAFVSGVAITITATQLSTLLGIRNVEESDAAYQIFVNIFKRLGETKVDAALGISALMLLYLIKWATGRLSAQRPKQARLWFFISTIRTVFTILLFIFISYLVNRSRKLNPAFRVVGTVPKGFHGTFKPKMSNELFKEILPNLPTLVIVLLLEHLSIAKSFGRMNNYTINPNSELLAIGVTNIIGPFVGGYAVSGSFSRTAINAKAGARTPLAGVITAILVVIAIYLLVPMLYFIPNSVLAAVIIHAILDLITSSSTLYGFWRANPFDLLIYVIGLTVMIFASVETGLYVTIALSMAIHLFNILKTHGHLLGSITSGTIGPQVSNMSGIDIEARQHFLPLDHSDGSNPLLEIQKPPPGVFVYRLADTFNFMNAARVLEQLVDEIKRQTRPTQMAVITKKSDQSWSVEAPQTVDAESAVKLRSTLKAIVLDFAAVNHIDVTAIQALVDTRTTLQRYVTPDTLQWHFVHVNNPWTKRALVSAGLGRPDFSAETGAPGDFVPVHAFAQQSSRSPCMSAPILRQADDVEANEKQDTPSPTETGIRASSEAEYVTNESARRNRAQKLIPLYGVNRPYFHPDIQSALTSVAIWLDRANVNGAGSTLDHGSKLS